MALFTECFSCLTDPRTGNAQRHDFLELLIIALLATLSGAESCVDFELFARSKEDFLREFVVLDGGIPSHDTFSRLFRLIDPQGFATCLQRFAQECAPLNLAVLRRIALNLTRANPEKGSIRGKIKRAAWDNRFLASLLTQMR
jgi:hypothetical protein